MQNSPLMVAFDALISMLNCLKSYLMTEQSFYHILRFIYVFLLLRSRNISFYQSHKVEHFEQKTIEKTVLFLSSITIWLISREILNFDAIFNGKGTVGMVSFAFLLSEEIKNKMYEESEWIGFVQGSFVKYITLRWGTPRTPTLGVQDKMV